MQNFPLILQQHIDTMRDACMSDGNIDLCADQRHAIYAWFDTLPGLEGRMARTHLSISASRQVLHVWDDIPKTLVYPTMPFVMLDAAEQLLVQLRQGVSDGQLTKRAQEIMVDVIASLQALPFTMSVEELAALAAEMDSLTGEAPTSPYYHPWCVFLAAMGALHEALAWPWWKGDSAGWAALAYAGGKWQADEHSEEQDSPQGTWLYASAEVQAKRRMFWLWWCTELVPATWQHLYS